MYERVEAREASLRIPAYTHQNGAQTFFLRTTFAFLLATGIVSFIASIAAIKQGTQTETYSQILGCSICVVAAYHYYEILKVRATKQLSEFEADALRYGDWVVTMPLLTLKFYAVIDRQSGSYASLFSPGVAALAAALMVALGSFVRLGLDELSGWRRLTVTARVVGITSWILSCICLLLLLIDITRAAHAHDKSGALFAFLYCWLGYPIVALLATVWRHADSVDTPYDLRLSTFKDAAFSCLDIFAKGVFALWSSSAVFGINVFD